MNTAIAGAMLNSALYLASVFIAGLVTAHPAAWKLAVTAMGVTYASYLLQTIGNADYVSPAVLVARIVIVLLSVGIGIAAGLALLI